MAFSKEAIGEAIRTPSRLVAACLALAGFFSVGEAYAKSNTGTLNLANPVTDTTDSLSVSYSRSGTTTATRRLTVNNGSKKADNRPYCVKFTLTDPGQQGTLVFKLINSASGETLSLSGSPGNQSQVISGTFSAGAAANTSVVFPIEFQVEPTTLPAPGTYTATILEQLYGGSTFPPSGSALDTNTLSVTVIVGSYYDVSIVPTGSAFSLTSTTQSLSFGTLEAGKSVVADVLVQSNLAYNLSLTSANGGVLVNATDSSSSIPYTLRADGVAISMLSMGTVATGAPATFEPPHGFR